MSTIKCFKAQCEKCQVEGLMQVFLNSNSEVRYCRVRHYKGSEAGKPKFSYCQQSKTYAEMKLKEYLSSKDVNKVSAGSGQVENNDQIGHKNTLAIEPNSRESRSKSGSVGWSSSLVRTLALHAQNSIDPPKILTLDFSEFRRWVKSKYSLSYANTIMCYSKRYYPFVGAENLRELDMLPSSIKNNAVKSLIALSKYLGIHEDFTRRLKAFDVKTSRPDTLKAFLRILNASNSDVLSWYNSTLPLLKENERLFAKFLLHSGLRMDEAINSFNMIIELAEKGKLSQYYDENLNCLCHFKYPKTFIRKTKNCFITFLTPDFLNEIANSEEVTYNSIRKRLERKKIGLRFNEFRDYFGTYLLQHGILEQEQNLLCGRIPVSIFVRHYWSPKLKELSNKILILTENLEKTLLS